MLDLCELHGSDERVDRLYAATEFAPEPGDDYTVAEPVSLRSRLQRDADRYHLVGQVESRLRLECGRCLEPFDVPVRMSVDLLFLPQRANTGDGESEISDEDLTTAFYHDDQIDLGLMIREQFQLSLPMKPLCRDTCRGLCPMCGVNLNGERCSCDTGWRDPRLEALAALRSDTGKD